LRERSNADKDLGQLELLIRQLGSEQFAEREEASAKLRSLGFAALSALRRATAADDREAARRARVAVREIERQPTLLLPLHVVRRLLALRPAGTVEALVRYLPYAVDEAVEEEIYFGLDALTVRAGKIDPALRKALADPLPARRAVAACLIGRLGNAEERGGVRRLLGDRDPEVRLRAAQGLLAGQDKAALLVVGEVHARTNREVSRIRVREGLKGIPELSPAPGGVPWFGPPGKTRSWKSTPRGRRCGRGRSKVPRSSAGCAAATRC
jgi:hypothetical protein